MSCVMSEPINNQNIHLVSVRLSCTALLYILFFFKLDFLHINGPWRGVRQPLFIVFGPMIMIVT